MTAPRRVPERFARPATSVTPRADEFTMPTWISFDPVPEKPASYRSAVSFIVTARELRHSVVPVYAPSTAIMNVMSPPIHAADARVLDHVDAVCSRSAGSFIVRSVCG